jgi:hypothetical protein
LKNVHKNLPQQAQKSPKCCSEHKKPSAFQRFCPTFSTVSTVGFSGSGGAGKTLSLTKTFAGSRRIP